MTRVLVVRPDRLGDVLLSTPVFEALKRHYPASHLTVMVRPAIAPLLRGSPFVDEVMTYEPEGRHRGFRGFFRLAREIRSGGFRVGVVLKSQARVAMALLMAGVRTRVGPLSKLHSFLVFNRGVRQRRSLVEMHEADYNLQLLRRLGVRVYSRTIATGAAVTEEARIRAQAFLAPRAGEKVSPRRWVAIHPGMGGSALNWPEPDYSALARELMTEPDTGVVITAGPLEKDLLGRFEAALGAESRPDSAIVRFFLGQEIEELAGLYSQIQVLVAPSTGPLHLAVALGKRVVSFYPAIRVQSAMRWGPYVSDESRASVFVPDAFCGQEFKCRGPVCHAFPCMQSIGVSPVAEQVRSHLAAETLSLGAEGR